MARLMSSTELRQRLAQDDGVVHLVEPDLLQRVAGQMRSGSDHQLDELRVVSLQGSGGKHPRPRGRERLLAGDPGQLLGVSADEQNVTHPDRLSSRAFMSPILSGSGRAVQGAHPSDGVACARRRAGGREAHVSRPRDAATGETVWCSDEVGRLAVISSPLLDQDGRIYLADAEAMHAFDPDGALLWESPIVGVPLSAQFTPGGDVVFITNIGHIYVLDRTTGAPVVAPHEVVPGATFDPADGVMACAMGTAECPSANTPAIDLATGRFFFTFWEPGADAAGIRAVQITEGESPAISPLWTNDALPGGSASSPVLSDDGSRVYLNDNAGGLHALDAATGEPIWSLPIGYATGGSPSLSPDGLIMPAGGGCAAVVAVADRGDRGEVAWRQEAWLNRGVSTQADGGRAYVTVNRADQQNDLVVVDTATGDELDREPLPGDAGFTVGTTLGPDGTVYVPTIRGQLFAFRPAGDD